MRVSEFSLGRHVSTLQATREPQDLLRSDEFWCWWINNCRQLSQIKEATSGHFFVPVLESMCWGQRILLSLLFAPCPRSVNLCINPSAPWKHQIIRLMWLQNSTKSAFLVLYEYLALSVKFNFNGIIKQFHHPQRVIFHLTPGGNRTEKNRCYTRATLLLTADCICAVYVNTPRTNNGLFSEASRVYNYCRHCWSLI